MSTSYATRPTVTMVVIVHPSNLPLLSFPSGREFHQGSGGAVPQTCYKVGPRGTQVNCGRCGDASIRSFLKKGLTPQLQGVWLADSPQLFVSLDQLQVFKSCFSQGVSSQ